MCESFSNLRNEQVAKLAYDIWERNGRPVGTAERDWRLAEEIFERGNPTELPFGVLSLEAEEQ